MKKFVIILFILIITGCNNDYSSIDKLSIISTIGIDHIDNEYLVTVEVLNPTKKTNKDNLDYDIVTIKGAGKSLSKALDDINSKTSNKLYLNHLELLIIGKDSINYIDDIATYFVHDNMVNKDFYVFYSNEKTANKLIYHDYSSEKNSDDDNKTANALFSSFVKPDSNVLKFSDFLEKYLNPYIDSSIPIMSIDDTKTDESITLNELFITPDFKSTYILKKQEAIIVNALNNKLKSSIYTFTYNEDVYTLSNTYDKISITPDFIGDEPYINIDVDITSSILECENPEIKLTKEKIDEVKDAFNSSIEERISKVISKLIAYNTDVLGFRNKFYNEYPKYVETNSDTLFSSLNIVIDVNTFITDFSLLKNEDGVEINETR